MLTITPQVNIVLPIVFFVVCSFLIILPVFEEPEVITMLCQAYCLGGGGGARTNPQWGPCVSSLHKVGKPVSWMTRVRKMMMTLMFQPPVGQYGHPDMRQSCPETVLCCTRGHGGGGGGGGGEEGLGS